MALHFRGCASSLAWGCTATLLVAVSRLVAWPILCVRGRGGQVEERGRRGGEDGVLWPGWGEVEWSCPRLAVVRRSSHFWSGVVQVAGYVIVLHGAPIPAMIKHQITSSRASLTPMHRASSVLEFGSTQHIVYDRGTHSCPCCRHSLSTWPGHLGAWHIRTDGRRLGSHVSPSVGNDAQEWHVWTGRRGVDNEAADQGDLFVALA